jgi:alpha-amylase/alpha-mannosidase (GH57 family)
MATDQKRYIIIHGHFYQPPRESPWSGLISPEPSAAPFPNWNERILSECYAANAHAHTMDGSVVRISNNYQSLNFDFGPTLIAWLARHGTSVYRSVLRADALSAEHHDGHGNAIAQAYNHSILPLLSAADKEIQIAWGIDDFVFRFGRRPDGLWLPECAADAATLEAVARAGIKFVILAPWQGKFTSASGAADKSAAGPFTWRRGDLSLAVFRFDSDLAGFVSFGDALTDGARLAGSITERALAMPPGSALLIATDGETFGHHKKAGAAELARALAIVAEHEDLEITNCAQVLSRAQEAGTFEIDAPSAWSCKHGVERWRSDCGCRLARESSQHWRQPLREVADFVKRHVDALYDKEAGELLAAPFEALKQSIRIAIDVDPATSEEFFVRRALTDETARNRVLMLFEMQRAAHAALTSCGWFFDDFGGLEGRIVLRWAARAVELAAWLAPSIEPELLDRLRPIHSNRREIGDAATLYLSLKTREARGRI